MAERLDEWDRVRAEAMLQSRLENRAAETERSDRGSDSAARPERDHESEPDARRRQQAVELEPEARELPDHERVAEAICQRLEISDPEKQRAVGEVYRVTRENTAPFLVKVTDDMLGDLRTDAQESPDLRAVFLGRDGHSLAIAARRLDPRFYAAHGREVVLSRAVVEAAVQDLEVNAGKDFPELSDFRAAGRKVDPNTIDGARQRLTEYLQRSDVPVGERDRQIVLIDTSFKGTVQELMTGVYPATKFQGRYVFYGQSPHDPHPGTKTGYAVHLGADHSAGGRPTSGQPYDRASTLSHQDAIGAVEETLHGSWSSPKRISPSDGPEQYRLREDPDPLDGLNPIRVAEPYRDPLVREASYDAALLAVAHYADHISQQRTNYVDTRNELQTGFDRYTERIRSWICGDSVDDPGFATVLDSFVRRADKASVNSLARAIEETGRSAVSAREVWTAYDGAGSSPQEKQAFVAAFRDQHGIDGKDDR